MSLKWERVKAWDDGFFPRWAWPVKAVLRALSSIWLAVILLSGVVLYGILASVPIGMLALIPTWLVYAAAFVIGVGGPCAVGTALVWAVTRGLGRAKATRLLSRSSPRASTVGTKSERMVACPIADDIVRERIGGPTRFVVLFLSLVVLACGFGALWIRFVWPHLAYHPPAPDHPATGLRLFGGFVDAHRSTTLRRLPGIEMTELEFYSAWPMRALLLVFVLNMVVATIRRIAFEFVNVGVLTVHTGIVLLALGAVFYSINKREGDTLLQAGPPTEAGLPSPGPPVAFFYDNTAAVLVVSQFEPLWNDWRTPEQRRLAALPRYNDYNVGLTAGQSVWSRLDRALPVAAPDGGTLDAAIEPWRGSSGLVDPDIRFRLVGYASYATPQTDWVRTDPAASGAILRGPLNPLRLVTLQATLPETPGRPTRVPFFFLPGMPPHRVAETPAFAIEYRAAAGGRGVEGALLESPIGRTPDLRESSSEGPDSRGVPAGPSSVAPATLLRSGVPGGAPTEHPTLELPLPEAGFWGLYVRIPGAPPDASTGGGTGTSAADGLVWTLEPGRVLDVAGYRLEVTEIAPEPPFPIVTEGYRGASSPVAQVRVTPPAVEGQPAPTPYTRWVYSRYPEINQDLLELSADDQASGMPGRRAADSSIDIRLIDASKLQVTIIEDAGGGTSASGRVVIRQRGGGVRTHEIADLSRPFEILPAVTLELTDRWSHAEAFERPVPVAKVEQDREAIGTHQKAMAAIEVTLANRPDFRRVAWLPFAQYLELGQDLARTVDLPDGRRLRLMFGRRQHRLPGMQVRLHDFQMLAYDHRGAPRDYQSIVGVEPVVDEQGRTAFEAFTHVTKLNAPLTAPWTWREDRSLIENVAGRLAAGLDPDQFKFSQAGWDAEGWRESQAAADAGVLPRPVARFTILGVGNQPGIHVIAAGGILMALGTPWAFYVKPWLVRRRRDRLAREASTTETRRHGESQ